MIAHFANGNVRAVLASVCITGVGVVSPLGSSRDTFRDRLLAGESGVKELTGFDPAGAHSRIAAQVADFNPLQWIPAMKLRRMDEAAQYGLVAAGEAFNDGAVHLPAGGSDDTGVVLGTFSAGGRATAEFLQGFLTSGPTGAPALLFNSTVANAAASTAGLELKLRGPNTTVSQKEASGLAAIATATDFIVDGRALAIAAGGVDAVYEPFFRAHDRFGVLSVTPPRPFDEDRSGFVLGEGAYALIVEPASRAADRGARPYATVLGLGASGDSVPTNAWPATGDAIRRTIRLALEDAAVEPSDVSVIYASANGAPGLDDIEAEVLFELFGPRPMVTSIKGAVGESGAASAAACAAACLCGRTGQVPPVTGLARPSQAASRLQLVRNASRAPGDLVLINGIASGGALLAMLLRVEC